MRTRQPRLNFRTDTFAYDEIVDPDHYIPNLKLLLQLEPKLVARALAEIREVEDLSLEEIATEAGVSEEVWIYWEHGLETPEETVLARTLLALYWTQDVGRGSRRPAKERSARQMLWQSYEKSYDVGRLLIDKSRVPTGREKAMRLAYNDTRTNGKRDSYLDAIRTRRICSEYSVATFLRYRREAIDATPQQMAARAGVETELWLDWESAAVTPTPRQARTVGKRIFRTNYLRDKLVSLCRQAAASPLTRESQLEQSLAG